ncbi:MAG: hypothetical protein GEV11_16015 [Streptosporangiales bacterium]|nr:hypothetical protein [Streptosporangiales bacterium]
MAASGSARPLSRRTLRLLMGLLAVLIAGLTTAAVMLAMTVQEAQAQAERREEVLGAARQYAVNLLSVDYRNTDQHIQRVLEGAASPFREEYAGKRQAIVDAARKAEGESKGESKDAAVISMDDDSAEVMVLADAVVSNKQTREASRQGVRTAYRWKLGMQKVRDRWLVSKVEMV